MTPERSPSAKEVILKMYAAYCQSNLSACVQVSTKFNPDCARLSVKVVQEYLKRSVTRQRVIHQTCGQLIRLEKNGPLVLPLIAPNHSMNVFGRKLARSDGCITPVTDRRRKLDARNALLGSFDEEDDELPDCEPADIWDGVKNEYPSWPDQITGIERRADALMLVENDEAGLKLMKEVEDLWLAWNSGYRLAFDDRQKQSLETSKHIFYDKKPPWREDLHITDVHKVLNERMSIHLAITGDFWSSFAPKLLHDWKEFFNRGEQIYLTEVSNEMDMFLRQALKISKFDWQLQVCTILLDHSDHWVEFLSDNEKCSVFFDSIAALETTLLRQVICDNYDDLMAELRKCSVAKMFCVKVPMQGRVIDQLAASNILQRLIELGTDVLRCECRLYPNLFPEMKTFSVASSVILDQFSLDACDPFQETAERLAALEGTISTIPQADDPVPIFVKLLAQFKQLRLDCRRVRSMWYADPFEFDYGDVKDQMLNNIEQSYELLVNEITSHLIVEYYTECTQKLYDKDQFEQIYNIGQIREHDMAMLNDMITKLHGVFWTIAEHYDFTETMLQKYYQASRTPLKLDYLVRLIWQRLQVDMKNIEKQVAKKSAVIFYEADMLDRELKASIKRYRGVHSKSDVKQLAARFAELSSRIAKLADEYPVVSNQLVLLSMDPINIDVNQLHKKAQIFARVSSVHKEIICCEEIYLNARVVDITVNEINEQIAEMNAKLSEVQLLAIDETDEFTRETLALLLPKIEKILATFNQLLPVINALCAEGMKQRHWENILAEAKGGADMKDKLLVKDLLTMNLTEKAEKCEEISVMASKEMILEDGLETMKEQWEMLRIEYVQMEGSGICAMKVSRDLMLLLEEQIIKTQMSISSPFAVTIMPLLQEWMGKLQRLNVVLDSYRKCENKWAYLEPMFSAEDIAYQMPDEWRMFQQVQDKWAALCEKLVEYARYIDLAEVEFQAEFDEIANNFHSIQCGFDTYLQKRKLNYPRLYFLSNNELLEMLSRAKVPEAVEPYLPKLFAAVSRIEFNARGEISAVYSASGEKFPFLRTVNVNLTKRHVDKWLGELEREMKYSVKTRLKNMMRVFSMELPDFREVLGRHTAQTILLYCRLAYTNSIENAITGGRLNAVERVVEAFVVRCRSVEPQNADERLILDNLLIDANSVIALIRVLIDKECKSTDSYEWVSQLRYYWSNDNLFIRVLNLSVLYNYEYLSVQQPFIITPDVRKIHRNLIALQSQGYAGMLKGPAATGKSETIKELARVLGRLCVVFNCSPEIDKKQLEDLLCGTMLSGSVLCLDEFNRLTPEVMSWVANHILSIYQSMQSGDFRYRICGVQMTINPMAAFFVTINPKFVARSELPANVSSAMKCFSMDAADLSSISDAYLQLAGFSDSDRANAMVSTFNQCDLTLSPMHHYDFHLRAVISTVHDAIQLKRAAKKDADEFWLVRKATCHVISPFLMEMDEAPFESILNANFRRVKDMLATEEQSVKDSLTEVCRKLRLHCSTKFLDQCYSLYHLSRIHQAFILLGESFTGKSTMLTVIGELLFVRDSLSYELVRINPSQFTSDTIYGHYDAKRLEWIPGIFTTKLIAPIGHQAERWIVLDGVLDSLWIESMNSLLDSNRKLCLPNGQTISLNLNVRIVFESDSLAKVAPSTVSRCRVIYFDEGSLPTSCWTEHPASENHKRIYDNLPKAHIPSDLTKKLYLEKAHRLLKLYGKFEPDDAQIARFVQTVAAATAKEKESYQRWIARCDIDDEVALKKIPKTNGDWTDLAAYKTPMTRFRKLFLKQLLSAGYLVVIYGRSGSGKTRFINSFVQSLDHDRWDVHLLSVSGDSTSKDVLNSILACNLIRLKHHHYAGPNEKNVLIIIEGFGRLRELSFNSVYEMFRSLYDNGQILSEAGEPIKFTSVYFVAEFTTDLIAPQKIPVPERLRRFLYPIYHEDKVHYGPANLCQEFLGTFTNAKKAQTEEEDDEFDDDINEENALMKATLAQELSLGCSELPGELVPLCHKYICATSRLESECMRAKKDTYVYVLEDPQKPKIVKKHDLIQRLRALIAKERNVELDNVYLDDFGARHVALMTKILSLPEDGHCVILGEEEYAPGLICANAALCAGAQYESLPIELTEHYWQETLTKVVRTCLVSRKKVLLRVPDYIHDEGVLSNVLSDLLVVINSGGLPPWFSMQQISQLHDKSGKASGPGAVSEWSRRRAISSAIRELLHVVFTVSKRSVRTYRHHFEQIFHYALLDNLERWTEGDVNSFIWMELEKTKLFPADQLQDTVKHIVNIHKTMCKMNPAYTKVHLVNFIRTLCHMVNKKRQSIETLENRYKTGIFKLNKADEQMSYLKQELLRLQPELVRTSLETTMLMSTIERETIEIENAREVVAANEFKANEAATKAQALKVECEEELAAAIPALEAAVEALQVLNQNDISMLKTMRYPPQGVRLCMEVVCILLGEKPVRVTDSLGKSRLDYWITAQKVLSDIHFLQRIRSFARDKVPTKTMKILRNNYLTRPEFDAEFIKSSSVAAEGLCLWVRAIDAYDRISKVVEPKKDKLKKAEQMVKQHMKQLEARRKALQDVTERLQRLSDQFSQTSQRKQDLQNQIQTCEAKMNRAERLLQALGSEKSRWDKNVEDLKTETETYRYNAIAGAAVVEYLSNVDERTRHDAIGSILPILGITKGYSLRSVLEHNSALLGDHREKAIENYVIAYSSRRPPLIIDPQGESIKMLQRIAGDELVTVEMRSRNLHAVAVAAVGTGRTLLIENVCEPVPLIVWQLVQPTIVTSHGTTYIQLETKQCHYSPDFRLYLRSERHEQELSEHFLQKVCVVNIAVGPLVIRESLTEVFLRINASQLVQTRDRLIDEQSKLLKQLDVLEEGILEVLAKSKDLDNDKAIDLLGEVRQLSAAYDERSVELGKIETQLTSLKQRFVDVADYGTRLVHVSLSLGKLSPFYARSTKFYVDVFREAVTVDTPDLLEKDASFLHDRIRDAFRRKISNALFREDRETFEFLTGNTIKYIDLSTMSDKEFGAVYRDFAQPAAMNLKEQVFAADSRVPIVILLSSRSNHAIRALFNLAEQLPRMARHSITDPTGTAARRIQVVPAEEISQFDWQQCLEDDQWLMLQNCQLLTVDQTTLLEELIEKISTSGERKKTFRMFIVMYPERSEAAAHSIFNRCNVLTVDEEMPLHAFLIHCYTSSVVSKLHDALAEAEKRDQLYRLCCFHFAITERNKYGIFGWATDLEVTLSGFESAVALFKELCASRLEIPFEVLLKNVLEVAYLGNVTDTQDVKAFRALARWIFKGLSKQDNQPIDSLFPKHFPPKAVATREQIQHAQIPNDHVLTGLAEGVTKHCWRLKTKKIHAKVQLLLSDEGPTGDKHDKAMPTEFRFLKPNKDQRFSENIENCVKNEVLFLEENQLFPERRSYLKSLLRTKVTRVSVGQFERPMSLFEHLKLNFVLKYNVDYDQVECCGSMRIPPAEVESLELADCYLLAAAYDKEYNSLQEAIGHRAFVDIETIWVSARRRMDSAASSMRLPLYHRSAVTSETVTRVLSVEVDSNLPETHWLLRGAKMTTFKPTA